MRKRKLKILLAEQIALAEQFCKERNDYSTAYELQRNRVDQLERDVLAAKATSVGVQAKVRVRRKDDPSGLVLEYPVLAVQSIRGETCVWVGPRAAR